MSDYIEKRTNQAVKAPAVWLGGGGQADFDFEAGGLAIAAADFTPAGVDAAFDGDEAGELGGELVDGTAGLTDFVGAGVRQFDLEVSLGNPFGGDSRRGYHMENV